MKVVCLLLLAMMFVPRQSTAQSGTADLIIVNLSSRDSIRRFSIEELGSAPADLGVAGSREASWIDQFPVKPVVYTVTVHDSATGRVVATTTTALKPYARNYLVYTGQGVGIWNIESDRFALFNGIGFEFRLEMTLAFGAVHTPMLGTRDPVRPWGPASDFNGLITIDAGSGKHYGGFGNHEPLFIAKAADGSAGVYSLGDPLARSRWALERWSRDSTLASMRLRVVNASRTATTVDVAYGAASVEINGTGPFTASRSYSIRPGALAWKVRINGGAWRPVVTTPLQAGTVYTILVARAPSDTGEVATIFDRPISNLLDSIHGFGNRTPSPAQAHLRGTTLPRSPGVFWGEFAGEGSTPGPSFPVKQSDWPSQMASIVPVDTSRVYVDIHGDMGMPMLDRIAFDGLRAGERLRLLTESRADSSFDAWIYDELDTSAQTLVAGRHLPLSTVSGDVRVLNLAPTSYRITLDPDSAAFTSNPGTLTAWMGSYGGRILVHDFPNGVEQFYVDSFTPVHKGRTTLVVYDTGSTTAPALLRLGTYPFFTGGYPVNPQIRFAVALGGRDSATLDVVRNGVSMARFERVAPSVVAGYRSVDTYEQPDEFRVDVVDPDNGTLRMSSTLALARNSYTTFILSLGPVLTGIEGRIRGGPLYLWALREFPEEPTVAALTLLETTAGVEAEEQIRPASIWPNPGQGRLSIRLEKGNTLAGRIVAVDILGRVAAELGEHNLAAGGAPAEVSISGLVPGAYTLMIRSRDGSTVVLGTIIRQ
jgi:hypothetical protein